MRVAWLAIFFIFSAAESGIFPYTVQQIPSSGSVLESSAETTWWATDREIDPVQATETIESQNGVKSDKLKDIWKPVHIPGDLYKQGISSPDNGSAWLMKTFLLTEVDPREMILRLGVISDRDRVYLNGKLIGSTGNWNSSRPQAYDRLRCYTVPANALKPGKINVIHIHVKGYFPDSLGIVSQNPEILPSRESQKRYFLQNFPPLLFLISYLTVASYFLFLFFRRMKDRENFFFAILILLIVVYHFFRLDIKYILFPGKLYYLKKIEYISLMFIVPFMYLFNRYSFFFPDRKWFRLLSYAAWIPIAGLFIISFYMFLPTSLSNWNYLNRNIVQPVLWPLLGVFMYISLIYAIYLRRKDARIMFAGITVTMLAAIFDLVNHRFGFYLPRITGYIFFIYILTLATVLANRFVRLHKQIEELNTTLEDKVKKRTNDLEISLNETRQLKDQQDGDYFLTAMLLEPLMASEAESDRVEIDLLVREKKRFRFKKWIREIGGDIALAQNIVLNNKRMLVFLNADAMGKSMQGAGGLLVAGSVFASILQRTRSNESYSRQTPEEWLKKTAAELNTVFETFDGTMFLSMFLGILDEETFLLHYVNAEHPFGVLYRDKKAEFAESEITMHKIGIPDNPVYVNSIQLRAGDTFVTGSDGRDDILIVNHDGSTHMNENQNLILNLVEKTHGKPELILEQLQLIGQPTDDISLIRIKILD